jgi:hypothetical protein
VVIGGVISSTLMTLVVLPTLYKVASRYRLSQPASAVVRTEHGLLPTPQTPVAG